MTLDTDSDLPHILVVDDDTRLRDLLRRYLTQEGFRVTAAEDAPQARHYLNNMHFDLAIVDIMMPGEDGLRLTRSLRDTGNAVPILLLTARGEPTDRIAGFEHGADDYLAKPYEPRELVLRVRSILRRTAMEASDPASGSVVRFGGFAFDPTRGTLHQNGEPVHLTASELALLSLLAAHPGEVVSREQLASGTSLSDDGSDDAGGRAVDVQIVRLRKKLGDDPRFPRFIVTVRGRGYRLRLDG